MKKISISKIVFAVIILFFIWFVFFRTKELTITYDGLESTTTNAVYNTSLAMPQAKMTRSNYMTPELAVANVMSVDSLDGGVVETKEEKESTKERYRENKFYRVDTESFEYFVEELTQVIKELNGTIKINQQNSNKKIVYDKEFYPRYQELEFTVDNEETDLDKIETTLKKWGNIRVSNSNITSIEQELTNYEQQLKEMEEARKALQSSKDKDWIAKQDSDLAKRSERIKNQIENVKKESLYKTYTINIYEVITFRVNALRYWYSNNYSLKNAVDSVLPKMVELFAVLIPITVILIVFILVLASLYRRNKLLMFSDKLEAIKKEFADKEVHFDIKM